MAGTGQRTRDGSGQGRASARALNNPFAILTTEPNTLVGQFRPNAIPVILTTQAKPATGITDDALTIVARGAKEDPADLLL